MTVFDIVNSVFGVFVIRKMSEKFVNVNILFINSSFIVKAVETCGDICLKIISPHDRTSEG